MPEGILFQTLTKTFHLANELLWRFNREHWYVVSCECAILPTKFAWLSFAHIQLCYLAIYNTEILKIRETSSEIHVSCIISPINRMTGSK